MHHRVQFGIRENPASDRRHGSRQAVLRMANKNRVNDDSVRVSGLTPAHSQPPMNIPLDLDATSTQAATGEERPRKRSRQQKIAHEWRDMKERQVVSFNGRRQRESAKDISMNSRFSSAVLWFQQYKMSKMKRSTVKTMQGHINNYLLPKFAGYTLGMITAEKVNEYLSSDDVSHLSPKSQKHVVTTLCLIAGKKFGRGAIRYPAPKTLREEEPCRTPEEMQLIIDTSEGQDKVIFAVAGETGMRAGEIYGLEVTDIDWIRNQIHVRRSVYDGQMQTPKTQNAYRVIDVKPWLLELIKKHIGHRKLGLLFMSSRGHAIRHTTFLRRHLHPLLKKLGIKKSGMHAFRHGRVSYLVEQGVARDIIKAWIGHGSDAMIERYLHLRTSYRAAALANIPSLQPNYPTSFAVSSGSSVAESVQPM